MPDVLETVYRVPLDSGEVAIVRPLSPLAYQLLLQEAEKRYPDPDKKEYEKPLDNAYDPSLTVPAEENPEYKAARNRALQKQLDWVYVNMVRMGIVIDSEAGQEATIERFKPQLRLIAQCVPIGDDPWLATVLYGMITTRKDIARIGNAARTALSQEDVRAAVTTFRREIQWRRPAGDYRDEGASGAQG